MLGSIGRADRLAPLAGASLLALAGCGGAQDEPRTTPTVSVVPPASTEPVLTPPPASPPSYPSTRTVLIDGLRGAHVLDVVGDFSLVGGTGTIALVGPEGHVRASHRFAFGADGASGVFLTPTAGDATHAVVGNGDQDGFRGPWGGELDRWSLDTDTLAQLHHLGYAAPLFARVGPSVVVVSPAMTELYGVTATGFEEREEGADQLGWAPGRPAECYVGNGEDTWLVRADASGALVVTEASGPVPESIAAQRIPSTWPMSATIGARGLPSVALEPSGGHLAISTSSTTIVFGPEGLGAEREGGREVSFPRAGLLRAGEVVSPVAAPALLSRSQLASRFEYPEDEEGATAPELRAFFDWRYQAGEAVADGQPIPPLAIEPLCNAVAPLRCVRARLEGAALAGWDYYDPARPRRVLGTIDQRNYPPGPGHALVAPGGRWIRIFNGEGDSSIVAMPRGPRYERLESWVELDSGFLLIDPDRSERLVFLPFRGGAETERIDEVAFARLAILDATHALAWNGGDTVEVLAIPSLTTERTLTLGAEGALYHCRDGGLADADGDDFLPGACPLADLDEDEGWSITVSSDRAFWVDQRLGDELLVSRRIDGARLIVRVTTDGVLVNAADTGVFEGAGGVLDHVVVREPGPVRTAPIVAGAEARARFERPGLVAAFFSGAALPTP